MSRAGFAAIIGAPNAGKSTLVNRLVGSKVSIVTHKVQTTRFPVRGVMMQGDAQVVLVDTPGIFAPKRRLDRAMVNAAWSGVDEADAVLLLIDAERGFDDESRAIVDAFKNRKRRNVLLALNKVDAVQREKLLGLRVDALAELEEAVRPRRLGQLQIDPAALLAAADQARVAEDSNMARNARLALAKQLRQLADRQLHGAQQRKDAQPRWVGERLEKRC